MIGKIREHWILILIIVAGIFFRFWGIDWGLPFGYDADEPFQVGLATSMVINGDFNPHWFGHPGTVAFYLLALVYSILFHIGSLFGGFELASTFAEATVKYPHFFLLTGRITLTLFGIASIAVVYKIALKLFNKPTALMAAAFLALGPVHTFYGKLIRTDIIVTFFLLMATYWSIRIVESRSLKYYIFAGVFTGLAVATKYTGVLIGALPVVAFLYTEPFKEYRKIVIAAGAGVAATFVGSPYLFLDWRTAKYNLIREARPRHVSGTGDGFLNDLIWYIQNPLADSITLIGLGAVIIALVICLRSKDTRLKLLTVFPLIFTLFISLLSLRWERWFVPALPFYGILAAYGLYWLYSLFDTHKPSFALRIFTVIVPVVVFGSLIFHNSIQGVQLTGIDTRDIGREWIINNIPNSSRIAIEKYTPYLPNNNYQFYSNNEELQSLYLIPDSSKTYGENLAPPFARIGKINDPAQIDSLGIEYIILSNWYDRYKAEAHFYPEIVRTYEAIMKRCELLHEIKGSPIVEDSRMLHARRGPTIRIFRVKQSHSQ